MGRVLQRMEMALGNLLRWFSAPAFLGPSRRWCLLRTKMSFHSYYWLLIPYGTHGRAEGSALSFQFTSSRLHAFMTRLVTQTARTFWFWQFSILQIEGVLRLQTRLLKARMAALAQNNREEIPHREQRQLWGAEHVWNFICTSLH